MLLFWICAGLLTVAAVLAITRPLMQQSGTQQSGAAESQDTQAAAAAHEPHSAADVAVYREQLAEIDADLARGLLTEAEAEAARIEIARRLLASSDKINAAAASATAASTSAATQFGRERIFTFLAAAVPVLALGLYLAQGSPGMPGFPIAERLAKAPTAGADVEELVARVETRLRANPSDGQGWEVVAPVYLKLERFQDAADAYRRANDLLGESARRLSGLAESLVLANDGIVTEEARRAYVRILELEPDRIEARFGLALALEQDGDLDGAEKAYQAILETAPPRAPWRTFVAERLDALDAKRGPSPGPKTAPAPATGAPATGAPSTEARGPTQGVADGIAALPEAERRQMILQMVEGLAARLKANGRDVDGWQRLMRSWTVLGDNVKAEATLAQARKALAGDDKALGEINAFAKGLGLKS